MRTRSTPLSYSRIIVVVASISLFILTIWGNEFSVIGVGSGTPQVSLAYGRLETNTSSGSSSVLARSATNTASELSTASIPLEPRSRFGVWIGGGGIDQVNLLNEAGAKWTRVTIPWSEIEPTYKQPASYNFGYLDNLFSALNEAGIVSIAEIRNNPTWAASTNCGPIDKPGGPEGFTRFVETLVSRYSQPPYNVKHWELYNEPDNADMGELGLFLGGCWGSHPDAYVAMLKLAHSAVKRVDPGAKVVLGGLAHENAAAFNLSFLDQILAAGVANYVDVMNLHYYSSFGYAWSAHGPDITGKVAAFRQAMASYGVDKPVMVTESGWTSSPKGAGDLFEQQAQYIPKLFARGMFSDLYVMLWFSLQDWAGADYPYGLADTNLQTRPSFFAYQVAVAELGSATSVRRLSAVDVGIEDASIEGYTFNVGGQERWVLWSAGDVVPVKVPARAVTAKSVTGSPIPLNANGTPTTIRLGNSPIYVHLTQVTPQVWLPFVAVGVGK